MTRRLDESTRRRPLSVVSSGCRADLCACVRGAIADPAAQHKLLIEHIADLRRVDGQAFAQVVLIPECNLGFEANHIVAAVQRAKVMRYVVVNEGASGGIGLLTTNETKAAMCKAVQELLEFDAISVSQQLICRSMSADNAMKQLLSEMRNYSIVVEPAKNPFGKPRQTFSGKMGGQQDDLIIALQLAVFGTKRFLNRPEYAPFRR